MRIITSALLSFLSLTIIQVHSQPKITKKDLNNFSYSLLDGRNVTMYAKLALGREGGEGGTPAARMMRNVFFAERNFRTGQTWMVQYQLKKLVDGANVGNASSLSNTELIVYSRVVNDLSIVNHHLGLLKKSEELARYALTLREQRLGSSHLATISSYNNLAALYRDMGKYVEASNLFKKANNQLGKLSMTQHMEYAIVLNNQSTLQLMLGQPSLALKTSDQALLLAAEHTGGKSKDYLSFMLNSAIIHQSLGHYPKAKEILLNIKEVKEKRFGKKSSQYARTLNNLAGINMEMGKMQEVEPLLKTALDIMAGITPLQPLSWEI